MRTDDLLSWYEISLPPGERKMRGHFSTPPGLVERMLDACGYHSEYDLTHARLLDPACGSGNFLLGAARRLLASGVRLGYDAATLASLVQKKLWGFDPDPVSCFLAEMQLSAAVSTVCSINAGPFHIHQADGLLFPWEQGEHVDMFLANPPYLAAKNCDLSGYRFARQRGQSDSYLLFLDLALRVVRPGGWIGLVLPDPVLARMNATQERRRLLAEATVHHLWHLSGVFEAYVGAAVIIAQKQPPAKLHAIAWTRAHWHSQLDLTHSQKTIAQEVLASQPGAELRYLLDEKRDPLVVNLWRHVTTSPQAYSGLVPLASLFEIKRGEELGKGTSLLRDEPSACEGEWYSVIRGGGEVRPYGFCRGDRWIERRHIVKPLERYLLPKILVVKSTGRLQAALDLQGHIVLQTLYLLYPRTRQPCDPVEDDTYFVLALLNSRLLQHYVYVLSTAYKWVQPQLEQHVLAHLPVPVVDASEKARIAQRAKLLVDACSEVDSVVELELYEEQERAIQTLYQAALEQNVIEIS